MIRRLAEKWVGHDRLLVAFEVCRAELADLRERDQTQAEAQEWLSGKYQGLREAYQGAAARLTRQRKQLNDLRVAHIRALTDLSWEVFLREQAEAVSQGCGKQIRLMTQRQAWEVADLLAERFKRPMYAHYCMVCPVNPITRDRFWHVTRKRMKRPEWLTP